MIIGIVGGVGCGKSTVLTYLKEKYNAYIIEADKVAKEIMEKGNEVYNKVIREFPESLDKDDNIDRKKLAEIVFNDAKKLETLNNITHPGTIKEITGRTIMENRIVASRKFLANPVEAFAPAIPPPIPATSPNNANTNIITPIITI